MSVSGGVEAADLLDPNACGGCRQEADQLKKRRAVARAEVGQLVEQRYGLRLPARTIGLFLGH
jgi:hypothetical protein